MRSRILTLAVAALLIGGTTGGAIASGGGNDHANAAESEYKPDHGCDKKDPKANKKCPPQSENSPQSQHSPKSKH
jgi:hypothetical protein